MQKILSVISIFLVILCSGVGFIYFNDDMDINIPYLEDIFLGIAIFLGFILLLKISSRWQGVFLGLKSKGYSISLLGFKKIIVYEGIMLLYFGLFGYIMLTHVDIGLPLGIIGVLFFIEGITHLTFNLVKKPYKILVNDRSITLITNKLTIIKWSEMLKIDSRQNDIHLMMKEGSPYLLDLDWLNNEDKDLLIADLNRIAQEKNMYSSIDVKGVYIDYTKLAKQRKFEK
jgi:hypothetical protein